MSWIWQGRQLVTAEKDGTTLNYTYDSEGIRTSKTVGSTTTKYLLNGTQILAQATNGTTLSFFYDQQGNRVGMADGSNNFYYYLYNIQGYVVALADASTGKLAATYTYDAWGKCTVTNASGYTIGTQNPFRYRGYYYDTETGLYYLNSRYYDANTGRFVNLDSRINGGVVGCNLYAYCLNNPVAYCDDGGEIPIALIPIAIVLEEMLISLGVTIFSVEIIDKLINCFTALEPKYTPRTSIPNNTSTKNQSNTEAKSQSKADTKTATKTESKPVYYGCRILANELVRLTGPMDYNEAYLWAITMQLGPPYGIGKGSNWGLYTQYRKDAYAMAFALGANTAPVFDPPHKKGYYSHFHTNGRKFNGIFRHFHVWFSN